MRRARYAVITTRNRPDQFAACYAAIAPQVDHTIVILHRAGDYTGYADDLPGSWSAVLYLEEPPNISRMWNMGLLEAEMGAYACPHDVAVLNDDAVVPPDWFERVTAAMRRTGAVVGCADQYGHPNTQHLTAFDHPDIHHRLSGFAYVVDGAAGLRLDEQFQWWWGDTDLDWRARLQGGTVIIPGCPVAHPEGGGGSTVGVLAEIAAADRDRFIAKWGAAPW